MTANTAGLGLGYNRGRGAPPFSALPAFCRVTATLRPSPSSDISVEVWLPLSGWNSHFRGTSPNGLGGVINYNAMGVGVGMLWTGFTKPAWDGAQSQLIFGLSNSRSGDEKSGARCFRTPRLQ